MKLPRRNFLHLAGGATLLPTSSRFASAQGYPSRPVRILVGFAAGGASDIVARLLAQQLSERFGQTFFVENRTGAGTNIATEAAVRAAPDGHTLLLATHTNAINATLYASLRFNFMRDITPVASVGRVATVMLVNPSFPAKTVLEFIAYANDNPGKINLTSTGTGNLTHLCGELFRMMTGIKMVHVPYRGAPAAHSALIAGDVHAMFDAMASALPQIQAGALRALGVTTTARLRVLPDVPPIGDAVPGYTVTGWYRDIDRPAKERDDRPEFDRLMSDARQGLFEAVCVYRLTRFARSVSQAARAYAELRRVNVALVSVTEDIDTTTASGQLMQNILFSLAEFESQRVVAR